MEAAINWDFIKGSLKILLKNRKLIVLYEIIYKQI